MTIRVAVIARPQRLHQTGENDNEKNVILNEVKNLYCGLTFCYDAILHFVQNDKGGRGRMTEGRFVIGRAIARSNPEIYGGKKPIFISRSKTAILWTPEPIWRIGLFFCF